MVAQRAINNNERSLFASDSSNISNFHPIRRQLVVKSFKILQ